MPSVPSLSSPSHVLFGPFQLNLRTRELSGAGETVVLQDQPYKLLLLLLERGEKGATREEIKVTLWADATNVNFDDSINAAVKNLRRALEDADQSRYIRTLPKVGYKLTEAAQWIYPPGSNDPAMAGQEAAPAAAEIGESQSSAGSRTERPKWKWAVPISIAALALLIGVLYQRSHRRVTITDKDTIVLSDFSNKTGDTVFDGTLRQGLSSHLEQSPFLQLLSDERISQTLQMMSQPKDAPLTPKLTQEICQRTQSAASIEGSIATLGSQYVVGLKAVDCRNGDLLADEQEIASDKEQVLPSLGKAASELRRRLGESRSSLQKYDLPLESVTTPSLEALKAYSLGNRAMEAGNYSDAVALGKQATSLDPDFAMAYMLQGVSYTNLNENERAAENIRAAYKLRDRVSGREKFIIESNYLQDVSRDLVAARKEYEVWEPIYPHPTQLGVICLSLGEYEEALAEFKSAVLRNAVALDYINVANTDLFLNRPADAEAAIQKADQLHSDPLANHLLRLVVSFLQHDPGGMQREESSLMGKQGYEDQALEFKSDDSAYYGHLVRARQLSGIAADSAQRATEKEVAASYVAESAVRDALTGNFGPAREQAKKAVAQSNGSQVEAMAALTFALTGDTAEMKKLTGDLDHRFPEDTIVQLNYLPTIRAAAALPKYPAKAMEAISPAERYELGWVGNGADFDGYPIYFRGKALLANHRATEAAAAFQKIIDHPGVVFNEPIAVLAYLELGRAYAEAGDTAKAKAAYGRFMALWQDADPAIPVHAEAKAEYAALQQK